MRTYSHIVIGAGGLGAAAAYWLSWQGAGNVLVLEQYHLGHGYGASEDHSRIIRHCYHSTDYTALTPAMYQTWREVQEHARLPLLNLPGCVDIAVEGTPGAGELATYGEAMAAADIPFEELTGAQIAERWPEWRLPEGSFGLFHQEAGILDIRRATAAHTALAIAHGVTFAPETPVRAIEPTAAGIEVRTPDETLLADQLVVCAGAWTEPLVATAGLDLPLTLSQEQVSYFATRELHRFSPERWPIWLWHADDAVYYGFPVYGEAAVKAARDMAGRFVTQETRRWEPDPEETAIVDRFLRDRLPNAAGPELYSRTCVYDMPPDRGFILDRMPGEPRICLAVGAGHGAKFASLLGKILAELSTTGTTDYPIEPFSLSRPAITDPNFVPAFRMTGG